MLFLFFDTFIRRILVLKLVTSDTFEILCMQIVESFFRILVFVVL